MLPPWRGGWGLVFTMTFVFSALLGDQSFGEALRVRGDVALVDAWWTPLTAPFALPEGSLAYLGVHLLVQWFMAGRLEAFWGRRRYLLFAFTTGIAGYLVAALSIGALGSSAATVGGPQVIDAAVVLAFARVFGREQYSLPGLSAPVAGRVVCVLAAFVVLGFFALPRLQVAAYVPIVAGLLVAVAFIWQPWRRSPKSGKLGRAKKASHLRVVRNADDLLH